MPGGLLRSYLILIFILIFPKKHSFSHFSWHSRPGEASRCGTAHTVKEFLPPFWKAVIFFFILNSIRYSHVLLCSFSLHVRYSCLFFYLWPLVLDIFLLYFIFLFSCYMKCHNDCSFCVSRFMQFTLSSIFIWKDKHYLAVATLHSRLFSLM